MGWIVLLIIVIIIGAVLGGDSFGEVIRGGCGCLIAIVIGLGIIIFIMAQS